MTNREFNTFGLWAIIVLTLLAAGLMGFTKPPLQYIGEVIFFCLLLFPWIKIGK